MTFSKLSENQKRIINPYPTRFDDIHRRGTGYDYSDDKNKFVIDAIHESYLYFYTIPKVGTILEGTEDTTISEVDLRAYFALYPQNGKMVTVNGISQPQPLSVTESLQQLRSLAEILSTNGVYEKYSTLSSPESYLKEYELEQDLAKLIAIPENHSQVYKSKLRKSLGLSDVQYSDDVGLDLLNLPPDISCYIGSDTNVDLYDWRNNCEPGDEPVRAYYNSADRNYYFAARTNVLSNGLIGTLSRMRQMKRELELQTDEDRYIRIFEEAPITQEDIDDYWNNSDQGIKDNYRRILQSAVKEILKITGRYSPDNLDTVLETVGFPPRTFPLMTYKDSRPGSRWTYAIKIPAFKITSLPVDDTSEYNQPSYQEYELRPLDKARRIINDPDLSPDTPTNKSSFSASFIVEELLRNLTYVRLALRQYDADLFDSKITPEMISNINLEKEVDRLNSFFDLLSLFYSYNQISIQDEDRIEMFFSDDYTLDHICINGSFYSHGCGNRAYINSSNEVIRVLDAFSLLTSTSFSFITFSAEIYENTIIKSQSNKQDVLSFLTQYAYPKVDVDAIEVNRATQKERQSLLDQRRKNVFQKLTQLSKGENALLYERLFSQRPLRYKIASTLSSIDCDTGQAKAAKFALAFWQAADSKSNIRAFIRQAIIMLREEAILTSEAQRFLANADVYSQNPDKIRQDIEKEINQQIFCSLDVLGDFIEDQFLDPLGAPPVAKDLVRTTLDKPIKIELKKQGMIGLKTKQSSIYKKAIETILLNFLKSVVAGIAKDVLNAVLGCAPEEEQLRDPVRHYDYGLADINDYVQEVDIVSAAEKVGIYNFQREVVDGIEEVTTTPPTISQLRSFIRDVSNIVTPIEAQRLLDGDLPNEILEHLYETLGNPQTIKSFKYMRTYSQFVDSKPEPVIIAPTAYNKFELTEEKIVDFFLEIGSQSSGVNTETGISPLEAYCANRDSFINPLSLQLDIEDAQAQYASIVDDKIRKINNLCDWLRDATRIKAELEALIDSLPMMTWYDDFLREIANLSNYIAGWLASIFDDLFGKDPAPESPFEYNVYHTRMGVELFFQIFTSLRKVPVSQVLIDQGGTEPIYITPSNYGSTVRVGNQQQRARNREGILPDWAIELYGGDPNEGATPDANFGEADAAQVQSHVNTFLTTAAYGPDRIPLPQYRNVTAPHYDVWDVSYYTLRHGPPRLLDNIRRDNPTNQISTTPNRENEERDYLSDVSEKVFDYFLDNTDFAPYNSYTGYNLMRPRGGQNGSVSIHYKLPSVNSSILKSKYNFQGTMRKEADFFEPGRNGNLDSIDYGIYVEGVSDGIYDIKIDENYDLIITNRQNNRQLRMPSNHTVDFQNTYGNYSIGMPTSVADFADVADSPASRDTDCVSMNNYRVRVDTTINNAVSTPKGKRGLPRYVNALNREPLRQSDDPCIEAEMIYRAQSAVQVIQTRIQRSLVNMMPLKSVYPSWGSVGTMMLLTDYFTRRIKSDLQKRDILGAFYSSISIIQEVYPRLNPGDENYEEEYKNNPLIMDNNTPDQNMFNIVQSILYGMMQNLKEKASFNVMRSIFEPNNLTFTRYRRMLAKFYRSMDAALNPGAGPARSQDYFGVPQPQRNSVRTILNSCYTLNDDDEIDDVTELGLKIGTYYFPISFQVASYLMWYDTGIKFAERYSDTYFRFELEIAGADDNLLTAVKGQLVTQFSTLYQGFPTSVPTYTKDRDITYFNIEQVIAREQFLDDLDYSELGLVSVRDFLSLRAGQISDTFPYPFSVREITGRTIQGQVVLPDAQIPESIQQFALADFGSLAAQLLALFDDANRAPGAGFLPQVEVERFNATVADPGWIGVREPRSPFVPESMNNDYIIYHETNNVYTYPHVAVVKTIESAVTVLSQRMPGVIGSSQDLLSYEPKENSPDVYFEQVARIYEVWGRYYLGNIGKYYFDLERNILRQVYYFNNMEINNNYSGQYGEGSLADPRTPEYKEIVGKTLARDFFRTVAPEYYRTINTAIADVRTESIELMELIRSNE
jgi:hypothetical protein